jgi:helix-turn-helix protein
VSNLVVPLVWTSTMRDPTEVAVLACVASHCNDFGEGCFAGIPRIAKMVRRSERTVQRTLQDLEAAGWLKVDRGTGSGNFTYYTVNVDRLKGCQDVTLQPRNKRVTPATQRVTSATQKGDIGDAPLKEGNIRANTKANNTPQTPLAGGADQMNSKALDDATERAMEGLGFTRRRDRRRLRAEIERLSVRGEPPAKVAEAMITERRKPPEQRAAEDHAARARADEANERESWRMWQGMSEAYKALNPWRGRVFEENAA